MSRVSRHRAEEALIVGRSEEGARFPISMVSSGVWAGEIPLERAHNLQEVGGGTKTMKQELERIGFLGDMDASYKAMPIGVGVTYPPPLNFSKLILQAHFELHIGTSASLRLINILT